MERIAIIGGGINGLVAANYLARGGVDVSLHERRGRIGGACVSESITLDGVDYEFPLGTNVLGFMQDFVFEETGLATKRVWSRSCETAPEKHVLRDSKTRATS